MSEVTDKIERFKKRLADSKEKVDRLKENKIKSTTRLEQAKEQEEILIDKIKNLGYNPDNLKGHISEITEEIELVLADIEAALPDENGNVSKEAVEKLKQEAKDLEDIEI